MTIRLNKSKNSKAENYHKAESTKYVTQTFLAENMANFQRVNIVGMSQTESKELRMRGSLVHK